VHVIFQPHRYSRTRDLMQDFVEAFEDADTVEMLDIYAASEEPIPGITAKALAETMNHSRVEYAATTEEAMNRVVARAAEGDAIFTLGAGNVSQLSPLVLEKLKKTGSKR